MIDGVVCVGAPVAVALVATMEQEPARSLEAIGRGYRSKIHSKFSNQITSTASNYGVSFNLLCLQSGSQTTASANWGSKSTPVNCSGNKK